ncbi:MAG: flagellar basal body rod protein FlgB, partial [Alphaproteobacteria bacterium]
RRILGRGMEGKLNIFAVLSKRMDWLGQRQKVLADNIANADTPNYEPRDLNPSEFHRILRNQSPDLNPSATHATHLQGTALRGGPARVERQGKTWETSPSGNAVVLEEQLLKVQKTQSDYQLMVNLYRKHMDMFRTALRGGG